MESTALMLPPNDVPLALNTTTKNQLQSYEDIVSYLVQLEQATTGFTWIKADVYLHTREKFGDKSLTQLANELHIPASTIASYIRTARAFPPEKRISNLSFTGHFEATRADSYDEQTTEFSGDSRFDWANRAADENMSTRELGQAITEEKEKSKPEPTASPCAMCHQNGEHTREYIFYSPHSGEKADTFYLHPNCYQKVRDFING